MYVPTGKNDEHFILTIEQQLLILFSGFYRIIYTGFGDTIASDVKCTDASSSVSSHLFC